MSEPQAVPGMKQARLVIWRSPNGRDEWKIIPPVEVPEWIKVPEVMAKLVAGDMAMDPTKSLFWYRAEEVPSDVTIKHIFAKAKRHAEIATRKARRRVH